jgi:hypothetical protein
MIFGDNSPGDKLQSEVYDWRMDTWSGNFEHHIAVMLFCMDSAIECMVYSLNALGQALLPAEFRSVQDKKALRRLSPTDVIGNSPTPGWSRVFPSFQQHLVASSSLITLIMNNHDTSKHRQQGFYGGKHRLDAPPGYFDARGLSATDQNRFVMSPMESVLIPKDPKIPIEERPPDLSEWTTLESLIAEFMPFINEALQCGLLDAKSNMPLSEVVLRKPGA